jgi:hypothetical protein
MSAGPSEQEDGRTERGLTYAFASTAAKTRARERQGFRRIAAPRQAAWIRPRRTTCRRKMSRIAGTLASRRSIGGSAVPPRRCDKPSARTIRPHNTINE